jgi:hypothetical protein
LTVSSRVGRDNTFRPFVLEEYNKLAVLRSALREDTIEMFNYTDSITKYRLVVVVCPCKTNNLRFTRFIVNARIDIFPYYRVVKGTELYPSSIETLSRLNNINTNFNLRQRRI